MSDGGGDHLSNIELVPVTSGETSTGGLLGSEITELIYQIIQFFRILNKKSLIQTLNREKERTRMGSRNHILFIQSLKNCSFIGLFL